MTLADVLARFHALITCPEPVSSAPVDGRVDSLARLRAAEVLDAERRRQREEAERPAVEARMEREREQEREAEARRRDDSRRIETALRKRGVLFPGDPI